MILASASPRRRELLGLLGIEFDAIIPGVEERVDGDPAVLVVENALLKARAGARVAPHGATLLGVDTDVILDGQMLGKPVDAPGAGERLRVLSEAEIDTYVASGEWRDRAGGYAVQGLGSSLIEGIDGDLSNVIGLPIPALSRMIARLQND